MIKLKVIILSNFWPWSGFCFGSSWV